MPDLNTKSEPVREVFPLLWSADVVRLLEWGKATLALTESWRAEGESGVVEHSEKLWPGGRISINVKGADYREMGPSGISLRFDDRAIIETTWKQAKAAGANIARGLEESRIAYSFTVLDPDGNQWWVNAETGFLDQLRKPTSGSSDEPG